MGQFYSNEEESENVKNVSNNNSRRVEFVENGYQEKPRKVMNLNDAFVDKNNIKNIKKLVECSTQTDLINCVKKSLELLTKDTQTELFLKLCDNNTQTEKIYESELTFARNTQTELKTESSECQTDSLFVEKEQLYQAPYTTSDDSEIQSEAVKTVS